MRRIRFAAVAALVAGVVPTACRRAAPSGPVVSVVRGPRPYRDPARPGPAVGTLIVAVRTTDAPEGGLHGAAVSGARPGAAGAAFGAHTDPAGVARFDSLPAGAYVLRVRRIGYRPLDVRLTVRGDCPQRVEAYVEPHPNCLLECPQVPARVTVTSCDPAT